MKKQFRELKKMQQFNKMRYSIGEEPNFSSLAGSKNTSIMSSGRKNYFSLNNSIDSSNKQSPVISPRRSSLVILDPKLKKQVSSIKPGSCSKVDYNFNININDMIKKMKKKVKT